VKVMFDTNIYIGWIRKGEFSDLLTDYQTRKYLSAVVLSELWAGARKKPAARLVTRLQEPYQKSGRIITLSIEDYIMLGQALSDLPERHLPRMAAASFVNDLAIALTARKIGAILDTCNRADFTVVSEVLPGVTYLFL